MAALCAAVPRRASEPPGEPDTRTVISPGKRVPRRSGPRGLKLHIGREAVAKDQAAAFHLQRYARRGMIRCPRRVALDVQALDPEARAERDAAPGIKRAEPGQAQAPVIIHRGPRLTAFGEKGSAERQPWREGPRYSQAGAGDMAVAGIGLQIVDPVPGTRERDACAFRAAAAQCRATPYAVLKGGAPDKPARERRRKRQRGAAPDQAQARTCRQGQVIKFRSGAFLALCPDIREGDRSKRLAGERCDLLAYSCPEAESEAEHGSVAAVQGERQFLPTEGDVGGVAVIVAALTQHRQSDIGLPFEAAPCVNGMQKSLDIVAHRVGNVAGEHRQELAAGPTPLFGQKPGARQFQAHAHKIRIVREDGRKERGSLAWLTVLQQLKPKHEGFFPGQALHGLV